MYPGSRPLLGGPSGALARPLCDHRRLSRLLGPLGLRLRPLCGSVDEAPPLEAATASSTFFFLVTSGYNVDTYDTYV